MILPIGLPLAWPPRKEYKGFTTVPANAAPNAAIMTIVPAKPIPNAAISKTPLRCRKRQPFGVPETLIGLPVAAWSDLLAGPRALTIAQLLTKTSGRDMSFRSQQFSGGKVFALLCKPWG